MESQEEIHGLYNFWHLKNGQEKAPRSSRLCHSLLLYSNGAGTLENSKLIVVCTKNDVGGDGLGRLPFLTDRIQGFLDQLIFNHQLVSSTPSRWRLTCKYFSILLSRCVTTSCCLLRGTRMRELQNISAPKQLALSFFQALTTSK